MKVKLGEICNISSAKRIFEKEYVAMGIPFIRGLEISNGSILNDSASFECYISKERYEELKGVYGVPQKGDILITAVGTIGNLCYIDRDREFYFKDGNIIWLKDIQKNIYSPYLYYFMKSPFFKNQLEYAMIGAVQKALTMIMLEKIEIELPDYEMQISIATILTCIDSKIENNKKINQELESMSKTIYDYWFLQFEFPNEDGKPYKSSGGKMVWNEELKREIPEGWKKGTFADLLDIGNGKDHKELGDGNIPVYGSGGVMRTVNVSIYNGESVLIPRKGTLNNIIYVNGAFWTVDTMFYTKMKEAHSAIFAYYSAKLYDFEKLNTGTGVPSMTSSIIYNLKIVIPPKEVLESFDNYVQAFYKQMNERERENRELASLRDFLLPLLMNGQVGFKK